MIYLYQQLDMKKTTYTYTIQILLTAEVSGLKLSWPGQGSARPVQLLRPKQQVAASLCTKHYTQTCDRDLIWSHAVQSYVILLVPVHPITTVTLSALLCWKRRRHWQAHLHKGSKMGGQLWFAISGSRFQTSNPRPLSLSGCLPDSSLCFISLRPRADKSWNADRWR